MLTTGVIIVFLNISKLEHILGLERMLLTMVTGTNWNVPGKMKHEVNQHGTEVAFWLC